MTPQPTLRPALVDTDVFSYLDRDQQGIGRHYEQYLQGRILLISFCSVGELLFRAYKRQWGRKRCDALRNQLRTYLTIDASGTVADHWARIRAESENIGITMSKEDAWIAASALAANADLVTNNWQHFKHLSDLPSFRQAVAEGFQVISFSSGGTLRANED